MPTLFNLHQLKEQNVCVGRKDAIILLREDAIILFNGLITHSSSATNLLETTTLLMTIMKSFDKSLADET